MLQMGKMYLLRSPVQLLFQKRNGAPSQSLGRCAKLAGLYLAVVVNTGLGSILGLPVNSPPILGL